MGKSKAWLLAITSIATILGTPPLRRPLLSRPLLAALRRKKLLPRISKTEREALEAGHSGLEREFFSGRPNLERIRSESLAQLTDEERAFLNGPVEELCRRVNDWEIWKEKQIPEDLLTYIKAQRFFGMIIPKEYGGLGFSALGHSEVISKLNSRSIPVAITVMVPNSLGPAELLIHYGTEEQKRYYLPRLADGREIPCFALTEPTAGSDASAIESEGVVFRGEGNQPFLRLNWNKRWITLGAISTVIGLAFRLKDPEHILSDDEDPGITCALIPSDTPGIKIGNRHDPLGVPFTNSPTQGKDVIVPITAVIGGPKNAGKGWRMLMESLAAGRGISLPATACGGAKLVARVIGAHAAVRKQFSLPLGKFEGVAEVLARIAGSTYLLEASRQLTCSALNQGLRPPVITAIAKYQSTELKRRIANDAMDIAGGSGISLGPKNLLAHEYLAVPIGITVEGANILTRTLMIIGQGAMRSHPFALQEIQAAERNDLRAFDRAIWGHVSHMARNTVRSFALGLSRGRLARAPSTTTRSHWQRIAWASADFAVLMDLQMVGLGAALRKSERVTGRLADFLSALYLSVSALRRFESEGERTEDRPLIEWSMAHCFHQMQTAKEELLRNSKIPGMSWLLRGPLLALTRLNPLSFAPTDKTDLALSRLLQTPGEARDRLTQGIFLGSSEQDALFRLEKALLKVHKDPGHVDREAIQVDEFRPTEYFPARSTARRRAA